MGKTFKPKKAKFDEVWVRREFSKYLVFELTGDFKPDGKSLKEGPKYAEISYRGGKGRHYLSSRSEMT